MEDFDRALAFTLKEEGGYANDPDDSGGATNFGVTQEVYDEWRVAHALSIAPVLKIDKGEVRAIYLGRFWGAAHCALLPWPVSLSLFDFAVNSGRMQASIVLQRVIGAAPDGVIGPASAELAAKASDLFRRYASAREDFLRMLAKQKPQKAKFLPGWMKRLKHLRAEAPV